MNGVVGEVGEVGMVVKGVEVMEKGAVAGEGGMPPVVTLVFTGGTEPSPGLPT